MFRGTPECPGTKNSHTRAARRGWLASTRLRTPPRRVDPSTCAADRRCGVVPHPAERGPRRTPETRALPRDLRRTRLNARESPPVSIATRRDDPAARGRYPPAAPQHARGRTAQPREDRNERSRRSAAPRASPEAHNQCRTVRRAGAGSIAVEKRVGRRDESHKGI